MHVCLSVCMSVCLYVCLYVCMHTRLLGVDVCVRVYVTCLQKACAGEAWSSGTG